MPPDLGRLPKRELHALYTDLQRRAHACFDEGLPFERASDKAAPLIEEADAIATEIVRRARRTARRAWAAVYTASALAIALIVWSVVQRS